MVLTFVDEVLPSRVIFGPGALSRVVDEVATLGCERVLVITGGSARQTASRVMDDLADRAVAAFSEILQHVPERLVAAARACARHVSADALVAVGGGSATGLAKAVAVDRHVPIVAVPTTYAGSEMTPIYGVTGVHKVTHSDPNALPRVVVYDPKATLSLPPRVTAASALNALAHCVEALYGPHANPVNALFAMEGLRTLARAVPTAVRRPRDVHVRSEALYGAYLAGRALNAGTGLQHRLCHIIGGDLGVVHADVHAVLLPHVVAFNTPAVPEAMSRVAAAIGANEAASGLLELAEEVGAPRSLAEIGVPEDKLDEVARRVVAEPGPNPRPLDVESIRDLLDRAYVPAARSLATP
jgi:maleylacetate reductase